MSFYGTSINDTATVTAKAAADISEASFLAAKFNSSGEIAKADTAGENVLGLLMAESNDIKSGDDAYVQIKEVGLWKTGAAVVAGAELTTDANGKAVKATSGNFITAIALEAATVANTVIKVQIVKAGYVPATSN